MEMKACNEKLKSGLIEAMKLDNARMEEELQREEPHEFSPEFEQQMEELMQVARRRESTRERFRYVAAAVLVLFLTGGILFIGSDGLRASRVGIDILDWLDEFFMVKSGVADRSEEAVLFEESQIGYIPEGFEKVGELEMYASVQYKYLNKSNDYIVIDVCRDGMLLHIDVEDKVEKVQINAAGFEYADVYDEEHKENILMWNDAEGIYYYVVGSIGTEELIKVMDSISYEGTEYEK